VFGGYRFGLIQVFPPLGRSKAAAGQTENLPQVKNLPQVNS
jgi:hypothetical protein